MSPSTMKAIKVTAAQQAELQDVPLPKLRDDYVLVKVKAVALNPTDWKHVARPGMSKPGCTVGCDFAGVVEQVGSKVTKPYKRGDRITGFIHGANRVQPEDGCFAEYAVVQGDISIKVPDNLSDEEAATLGVGITTVGQGLYQSLGLPLPGEGSYDKHVLIYGGSTATGTLAIQFAKLSGAKVITTCSPRNFELVKSLGAVEAFDYSDLGVSKKIKEYTNDSLVKVFDCISEGESPKICEAAVSSKGGEISYLLPAKHTRGDIENKRTLAYTAIGEAFSYPNKDYDAISEDRAFGKQFWELSGQLLAEGKIAVHPPEIRVGGLNKLPEGLSDLKDGKVSGKKLVYRVEETS